MPKHTNARTLKMNSSKKNNVLETAIKINGQRCQNIRMLKAHYNMLQRTQLQEHMGYWCMHIS